MEAFFLDIVNMSITAAWAALAVMLLRGVFKKAPRSLLVCLWAVVGLRLVLPFSFESVLSLIPSTETLPEEFLFAAQPELNTGIPALNSSLNPIISGSLTPDPVASANPTQILSFVFSQLWILGMVVMALYAVLSYLRIRRKTAASIHLGNGVYLCDYIDTPFILGIVRPRIFIPGTMDEQTMAHVLAHERAHLSRRDHLWKPLGFLLLTIHWFNPVLWIAYILLCRDIELACDERVIRALDASEKKAYSSALLQCSVRRPMIAACPLAFGEVGVKQRVKSILKYRKPALRVVVIAAVLCAILAVCFLTDPMGVKARDIVEYRGYVNLVSCRQSFDITIPLGRIPNPLSEDGITFRDKEIVVYETETSTVFLKEIQSGHQGEVVEFYFDIAYDLPKVGTMICPNYYFTVEEGIGSGRSMGPNQEFGFNVYTELLQGDSFTATVTMNQITYAKAGHKPELHNGKTTVDKNYFNWAFSNEFNYEVRMNDLNMPAFAQPYQEFAAMTVDYADAIAYLMDTYDLDPIEPFRYEAYKKYGAQTETTDTQLNQACLAVSQILDIYENSFMTEADAVDTPITRERILGGTYHSGEAAFWNPLSSQFYPGSGISMVVSDGTITVNGQEPAAVSLYWQDQCPMPEKGLEEFLEFYSGYDFLKVTFDEKCRYQPINEEFFLMEREEKIYLVKLWGDEGLNALWYIVQMHHE